MEGDFYKDYNEAKYADNYWGLDRSKNKWFSKFVKKKIIGSWIKKIPSKEVLLDAGGGVGNWAFCFMNSFKKTIVLDVSKISLERILEKSIVRLEGSVLDMPLKNKSVDCIILMDVFEHIYEKDLIKMMQELKRILKDDGRILIFTSHFGYGIDLFWKKLLNNSRLTKADISEGHLNRLTFNEISQIIKNSGLNIEDYYHYSMFFQQFTDFIKDSSSKIIEKILRRKNQSASRQGQSVKESTREKENNVLFYYPLLFLSLVSYLDIIFFGKMHF